MIGQIQAEGFDREAAQSALRIGLRAVARQPAVLSRWQAALSINHADPGPSLAWIPGAESMTMLLAMPLEARQRMLTEVGLTENEQSLLHPVLKQLGEETEAKTATRLLRSLPKAAQIGALLLAEPEAEIPPPAEESPTHGTPTADAATLERRYQALTDAQRTALQAISLLQVPVPVTAADALLAAAQVENPTEMRDGLVALGLLDTHAPILGTLPHIELNPHIRPLLQEWPGDPSPQAHAVIAPLLLAWRGKDGTLAWHPFCLELFRLARLAGDLPAMAEAAVAGGFWLLTKKNEPRIPLVMVQDTLSLLESSGEEISPDLLLLGADCAQRLGEHALRQSLLEKGSTLSETPSPPMGLLWLKYSDLLMEKKDWLAAEQWLRRAEVAFQQAGKIRSRAVSMHGIAYTLWKRGEMDEALRMGQSCLSIIEQTEDSESTARILHLISRIRVDKGIDGPKTRQDILADLRRAWQLVHQPGSPGLVAIGGIGKLMGQILAMVEEDKPEAIAVLNEARDAWKTLNNEAQTQHLEELIRQVTNGEIP
ncbi:MAG: hypothetical protein H7836_01385 [Magnetococcus sp. YQC-3]